MLYARLCLLLILIGTCQGESPSATQIIRNHEGGDNLACDSARAPVFGESGVENCDAHARRGHLEAGNHREAASKGVTGDSRAALFLPL